jgi:hypothetical protein
MMHERENSDPAVVAVKPVNATERSAAESAEPRAGAEENASEHSTHRAQNRACVSQALERIRQVVSPSRTQGGSRMRESRTYGSVRGRSTMSVPTAIAALAMTVPSCHRPPPGLASGEPDDRLRRTMQYSSDGCDRPRCRGVLDRLVKPGDDSVLPGYYEKQQASARRSRHIDYDSRISSSRRPSGFNSFFTALEATTSPSLA